MKKITLPEINREIKNLKRKISRRKDFLQTGEGQMSRHVINAEISYIAKQLVRLDEQKEKLRHQ